MVKRCWRVQGTGAERALIVSRPRGRVRKLATVRALCGWRAELQPSHALELGALEKRESSAAFR